MIVVVSVSNSRTVEQTDHRCDRWDVPYVHGGISPHDRSRGLMAAKAIDRYPGARWLLWLDDDISVDRDLALTLPQVAVEEGAALCSGLYVCRHEAAQGKFAINVNYAGNSNGFPVGDGGQVIPICACGFGLVATSRDLLERFPAPRVLYQEGLGGDPFWGKAWFLPKVRGTTHLGEDRSFCSGVIENRLGTMVADTRVLAVHGGHGVLETMDIARPKRGQ